MKKVVIQLDPETLQFSVDNQGFQGKGCSAVVAELVKGNTLKKDIKKPEFKQEVKTQVCQ